MTKVNWLIETDVLEEHFDEMERQCELQGFGCKKASGQEALFGEEKSWLELFEPTDCVVYRGSIEFGAAVQRRAPWVPGVYCDMPKYDCTNYYPYFGDDLMNSDYVMLPFGELQRRKEWLFDAVGDNRAVFIRPNKGNKIFTGQVVYKENWDKDVERLGFYQPDDNELCIVAPPYNIEDEYRFVVVDGKIVTGSLYRVNETVGNQRVYEDDLFWIDAQVFADLAKFNPERVWTLDTAVTKGGMHKVMEAGCFSCAGLYACDIEAIVREVSKVALEEWGEYNEC